MFLHTSGSTYSFVYLTLRQTTAYKLMQQPKTAPNRCNKPLGIRRWHGTLHGIRKQLLLPVAKSAHNTKCRALQRCNNKPLGIRRWHGMPRGIRRTGQFSLTNTFSQSMAQDAHTMQSARIPGSIGIPITCDQSLCGSPHMASISAPPMTLDKQNNCPRLDQS